MTVIFEHSLSTLTNLETLGGELEIVTWQEYPALRLEKGLALFPAHNIDEARIQVWILTEKPAYPGVAFRIFDRLNFELAYAVPHVSGQWDALQYDPVFHGSNTWQVYYGSSYQRPAQVPTGRWFLLQVDFSGQRAAISVDGQSPLVVERLAHPVRKGLCGLWAYHPAYFRSLSVTTCPEGAITSGSKPRSPDETVQAWFLEDFGVVTCEPNGVLNLNRYLPHSWGEVCLVRYFDKLEPGPVMFDLGFSDMVRLELDDQLIFEGTNTFKDFSNRAARGYAELGAFSRQHVVSAGHHCLTARLRMSEPYGWGLILAVLGDHIHWQPAALS
ncbi:hypothetical protein ACFL27_10810 [candidate division CSSED10-310 bacterium]|uniref:DUF1080 domain-containing protein n=1 Tax=candidate division CSSED10-310 bacterium TaxID=2855610 RepID=A0ABV6YWU1_UNCC1